MSEVICYNSDGSILDHFSQWDIGQRIIIKGAITTVAPEFHFSNILRKNSLVVPSIIDNEDVVVNVPDEILQEPHPVVVHVYYETNQNSAKTVYTIIIPVNPRPKPEGYFYEEKKIDCNTLINLIYKVGSVYHSTKSTSPEGILPGAWKSIGSTILENDIVYMWKRIA